MRSSWVKETLVQNRFFQFCWQSPVCLCQVQPRGQSWSCLRAVSMTLQTGTERWTPPDSVLLTKEGKGPRVQTDRLILKFLQLQRWRSPGWRYLRLGVWASRFCSNRNQNSQLWDMRTFRTRTRIWTKQRKWSDCIQSLTVWTNWSRVQLKTRPHLGSGFSSRLNVSEPPEPSDVKTNRILVSGASTAEELTRCSRSTRTICSEAELYIQGSDG